MKVEEDKLREVLRLAIADANNRPKTFVDKLKELMFNMYGITSGEVINILNGQIPVELMQKDTMFKLTSVLYEINKRPNSTFDYDKLNVDDYFTEREKDEFNQKISRNEQDTDIIIKAGSWMQVEDDQYVIKIYPDDLMTNYINKNKINYNPETQRDLTIKETKTGKVKMITFDTEAFESICASMANNTYISDMLALNVNLDFYAPPKIVRGDLVIPKESQIDCIDGYHRLRAAITTKLRNPNWNKPLTFYLFICDVDKAVKYILQQDEKIHLSDEQVTKSDTMYAANFIINKLNEKDSSYIRNTITDEKSYALNKVIAKIFNPKKLYTNEDRQDAVQLYLNIEKNINQLIEQNNMYKIDITKEMWFIYLYVLKHCLDNNIDFVSYINKLDIDKLIKQIQFNKQPIVKHYTLMKGVISHV